MKSDGALAQLVLNQFSVRLSYRSTELCYPALTRLCEPRSSKVPAKGVPAVSDLTVQQLHTLLEQLDEVCQQARELSDSIKRRLVQSARENYPVSESFRPERGKAARKTR